MWHYIHTLHRHTHSFPPSFPELSIRLLGFSSSRQLYMGTLHTKDKAVSAMQDTEQPSSTFLGSKVKSSVKFANLQHVHSFEAWCFLDTAQCRGRAKLEHLLTHLPPFTHS